MEDTAFTQETLVKPPKITPNEKLFLRALERAFPGSKWVKK